MLFSTHFWCHNGVCACVCDTMCVYVCLCACPVAPTPTPGTPQIRRVDARVVDLETAARDREKEYQRQLAFLRPQVQEAGDAPGTVRAHASPGAPPRELHLEGGGHSSDDGGGGGGARGGRRRRGGSASGRRGSTAGGAPPELLKKCTVLMYNVDSPMMQACLGKT